MRRSLPRGWRGWFAFVLAWKVVLVLFVAVCTMGASCGNQNLLTEPLYIKCKGKGVTNIIIGPYAGRIESECGDGFEYSLERARK